MSDETKKLYEVRTVKNEYHHLGELGGHHGKRPEWVYFCEGPGSPGYYGFTLQSHMYFDTHEQAEAAIPMLEQAYIAGVADQKRRVKKALGI